MRTATVRSMFLCLACLASPATGLEWTVHTLDSDRYAGPFSSLSLDSMGNPNVSYFAKSGGVCYLRFAKWDGNAQVETIEAVGSSWGLGTGLALDALDRPHISYNHRNGLKYARSNGASWQLTTVDSGTGFWVGPWSSIALDSNGNPRVSYFDNATGAKFAIFDGQSWLIEVAGVGGVHNFPGDSLAIDKEDKTHFAGLKSLRLAYATRTQAGWSGENNIAFGGLNASLVLDNEDKPHIAHGQPNSDVLRYTVWDGSQWQTQVVVPSNVHTTGGVSLALNPQGRPRLSYIVHDELGLGGGYVEHAMWNGTSWEIDRILDEHTAGSYGTSLAIDEHGVSYITYYSTDQNRGLVLAIGVPEPGTLLLLAFGGLTVVRRGRLGGGRP